MLATMPIRHNLPTNDGYQIKFDRCFKELLIPTNRNVCEYEYGAGLYGKEIASDYLSKVEFLNKPLRVEAHKPTGSSNYTMSGGSYWNYR